MLLIKMLEEEDRERELKRKEQDERENSCSICYEPLFDS